MSDITTVYIPYDLDSDYYLDAYTSHESAQMALEDHVFGLSFETFQAMKDHLEYDCTILEFNVRN